MLRPSLASNSPKSHKVFVFGAKAVGKTSVLRQAVLGRQNSCFPIPKHYENTIEDIYTALVENGKGSKERVHFFETPGLEASQVVNGESLKNYIINSDGIILVYSITSKESFLIVEQIKKAIDRYKEKKEIPIVCLANKADRIRERRVELDEAHQWSSKERIRLFEVSSIERKSLLEPFLYLSSKLNVPQNKSAFPQLGRKVKGNTNITLEL